MTSLHSVPICQPHVNAAIVSDGAETTRTPCLTVTDVSGMMFRSSVQMRLLRIRGTAPYQLNHSSTGAEIVGLPR